MLNFRLYPCSSNLPSLAHDHLYWTWHSLLFLTVSFTSEDICSCTSSSEKCLHCSHLLLLFHHLFKKVINVIICLGMTFHWHVWKDSVMYLLFIGSVQIFWVVVTQSPWEERTELCHTFPFCIRIRSLKTCQNSKSSLIPFPNWRKGGGIFCAHAVGHWWRLSEGLLRAKRGNASPPSPEKERRSFLHVCAGRIFPEHFLKAEEQDAFHPTVVISTKVFLPAFGEGDKEAFPYLPEIHMLLPQVTKAARLWTLICVANWKCSETLLFSFQGAVPKGNATKEFIESLQLKPGQVVYKCPKCCSIKPDRAHHCRYGHSQVLLYFVLNSAVINIVFFLLVCGLIAKFAMNWYVLFVHNDMSPFFLLYISE